MEINTALLYDLCMANTPKEARIHFLEFCERHGADGMEAETVPIEVAHKTLKMYYSKHHQHKQTIELKE